MQIVRIDETPSTNNYASSFLKNNEVEEGTVFITCNQTDGRGQGTNQWESEAGSNLTFSLILKPVFLAPADQFQLSQVVSLGIADFLSGIVSDVKIKWPNDLIINGRKLAGILLEHTMAGNQMMHTIAGIGLNINQKVFKPYKPEATSLSLITGSLFDTEDILTDLTQAILNRYSQLKQGHLHLIQNDYLRQLLGYAEKCRFRSGGRTFEGVICGTDSFGRLQVRDATGKLEHWQMREISILWD